MNENDKNKLNSAFGGIDEKYLEEAARPIKGKRRVMLTRLVSSCAALAIAAVPLVYFLVQNRGDDPIPQPPIVSPQGSPSYAGETTRHPLGTPPPVLQSSAHADTLPESPDHGQTTAGVPDTEDPIGSETYVPDVLPFPEFSPPTITVTSNGKTVNMSEFLCYFSYEGDDQCIEGDGPGAEGGFYIERDSIETVDFNPSDINVTLTDGTVKRYSLYQCNTIIDGEPILEALEIDFPDDLSELTLSPGAYYLVVTVEYGTSVSTTGIWVYDHAVKLYVPEGGGSINGELKISVNGSISSTARYMVFVEEYFAQMGGWAMGDGPGFDGGFSLDTQKVPEFIYSENLKLVTENNATVGGVTLYDREPGDPLLQTVRLNNIDEIHDHPGLWYVVIRVTYRGNYISAPDLSAYERACFDHVFRIEVPSKVNMPERMINAENVEYISHYSVYAYPTEYDFHTRYFTSPEKISAFTELLSGLEFATGEPLNIDDIILPEGGGNQVVTVKMKSGEVSEFSICANSWISSSHSEPYYELSRNDSSSISALLDSVIPDRIDMIGGNPTKLSVMQESPNSSVVPYEKVFGNTDDISLLIECVNSLQIVDIEQTPPDGGFRWSITDPTNGGYGITFIDMKYVYVGGVWYAISGESGELLNETVSSLPSDHAVREYDLEQALGQVTVGTSRTDVQIFFGMPKIGTFYEFKDGKYIEIIYEDDMVSHIIVHDKWFDGN